MNFRVVRWLNAELVNHIVQLIAHQAKRLCYRRLRGLEGYAVGLKKSLRHHPQGHNNTSSHAHDEVNTMLYLRRAAVVYQLLRNLPCFPIARPVVMNAPCVIRTHDRLLRRQLLYPAELREHPVILAVRAERHGWISAIGF